MKKKLIIDCLVYILAAIAATMSTFSLSLIIEGAENQNKQDLLFRIAFATGVFIFSSIVYFCQIFIHQEYLLAGDMEVKNHLIFSIFRRPIHLFSKKEDAYYVNMMINDTASYREQKLGAYPWIAYFITTAVTSIIMLVRLSWTVAIVVTIAGVIPFLGGRILSNKVKFHTDNYSKQSEQYQGILNESIVFFEEIKLNNAERMFGKRLRNAALTTSQKRKSLQVVSGSSQQLLFQSAELLSLVAIAIGAIFSLRGYFSAAMLYAVSGYAVALANSFSNIIEYTVMIRSMKNIHDKLKSEMCVDEEITDKSLPINNKICFENVSFGFNESEKLFSNLSFSFEEGGCYAIVGESGRGKSTLVKLLLKYYPEYSGRITFGGVNINDIAESFMYKSIAVVSQNSGLFNESIKNNITMLSNSLDEEKYNDAVKSSGIIELVERVKEEKIGDFGDKISGGEKQRIKIARSLYQNKKVIIFDEPTNGLDPENTEAINNLIFNLKGTTRIVITHNWDESFLAKFDNVVIIGK